MASSTPHACVCELCASGVAAGHEKLAATMHGVRYGADTAATAR